MLRKLIKLIKTHWLDPVWSNVFAGIILFLLSAIGLILNSLIKKIPFSEIYNKSLNYLFATKYTFNLFTLIIIAFVLLIIILPTLVKSFLKASLLKTKFPRIAISNKGNLDALLAGNWTLSYHNKETNYGDTEKVIFMNGTNYFLNGNLDFILKNITFDAKKKEITWTKVRYPSYMKHSVEKLTIIDENKL
jgi:hypothetical protein